MITLHRLIILGSCPKSVILTGDKDPNRSQDQFGIYNLIKFDENRNAIYEHVNKPYSLRKESLKSGVRGWWVSR